MKQKLFLSALAVSIATWSMGCAPMAPTQPGSSTNPASETTKSASVDGDIEYREAVLSSQSLELKVPAAQTQGSTTPSRTAQFYLITHRISTSVNRGVIRHLNFLEDISSHPPTLRAANKRVWGPWTPTLSPATYLFAVERVALGRYNYLLQGKPKGAANSAYSTIFAGVIQRGLLPKRGAGTFVVDFDTARRLDPVHNDHGVAQVAYDNRDHQVKVVADVKGSLDSKGKPTQAHYEYSVSSQGNGEFKFAYQDDIVANASGASVQETAIVHSRWEQGGAGRADAVVTNGDLASTKVLFRECWDTLFQRTYYTDNKGIAPTEGDANHCAL